MFELRDIVGVCHNGVTRQGRIPSHRRPERAHTMITAITMFLEDKIETINNFLPIILGVIIVVMMLPILWVSGASLLDLITFSGGVFGITVPLSVAIYVLRDDIR